LSRGRQTSAPLVRQFAARLPQTEQGAFVDAQGRLSSEGATRVRNAILAKAYGDSPILARIAESTHDDIRSISTEAGQHLRMENAELAVVYCCDHEPFSCAGAR
jgi:hypothetical protein